MMTHYEFDVDIFVLPYINGTIAHYGSHQIVYTRVYTRYMTFYSYQGSFPSAPFSKTFNNPPYSHANPENIK